MELTQAQRISSLLRSNPPKCAALHEPGEVAQACRLAGSQIEDHQWKAYMKARENILRQRNPVTSTSTAPLPPIADYRQHADMDVLLGNSPVHVHVDSVVSLVGNDTPPLDTPFGIPLVDLNADPNEAVALDNLSVADLREKAKAAEIKGWSTLKKAALIEALQELELPKKTFSV